MQCHWRLRAPPGPLSIVERGSLIGPQEAHLPSSGTEWNGRWRTPYAGPVGRGRLVLSSLLRVPLRGLRIGGVQVGPTLAQGRLARGGGVRKRY